MCKEWDFSLKSGQFELQDSHAEPLTFIRNGARVYKCPFCPKEMKNRSHIKEHIRVHTGERPFVCEICSYAFIQRNILKTHMRRVHHKEL